MKTASENYCIIFVMKNILKKILYYMLSIQEKTLSIKLGKSLKTSYTNKTSKTILSSTEHMTLTLQTEKNKDTVKKNVEDIVKNCQNNPQILLEYIIAAGTKVYKLNNAAFCTAVRYFNLLIILYVMFKIAVKTKKGASGLLFCCFFRFYLTRP